MSQFKMKMFRASPLALMILMASGGDGVKFGDFKLVEGSPAYALGRGDPNSGGDTSNDGDCGCGQGNDQDAGPNNQDAGPTDNDDNDRTPDTHNYAAALVCSSINWHGLQARVNNQHDLDELIAKVPEAEGFVHIDQSVESGRVWYFTEQGLRYTTISRYDGNGIREFLQHNGDRISGTSECELLADNALSHMEQTLSRLSAGDRVVTSVSATGVTATYGNDDTTVLIQYFDAAVDDRNGVADFVGYGRGTYDFEGGALYHTTDGLFSPRETEGVSSNPHRDGGVRRFTLGS